MYIHLKVFPDSKKDSIEPTKKDNYFYVYVKEPAEDNRANRKVLELVKKYVKGKSCRLIKGQLSPKKIVEIED